MQPDTKLGPYRIIEPLGAGGMGEVYLAEDTRLGRKVAIKVLPADFASDPERLARFQQEAQAAAALNHPNIAIIHDVGAETDEAGLTTHFMVQEYLEGETLRDRLAGGPLPLRETVEYAGQIARGLARAHGAGIVHRDLKPENLFLTPDGAKILDFGLAKLTEMSAVSGDGSATMSPTLVGTTVGQLMGTAGYMAPEQVRGETVDQRADLFAFGCVLHEMLTGHRAFAGRTVHATLDIILNDDPEAPGGLGVAVPARVEWIRAKCLDKELSRRYQHADELAVDLARFAEDLSSGDLEVPPVRPAESSPGTQSPGAWEVFTSVPGLALLALTIATAVWAVVVGGAASREPEVPDPVQLTRFTTSVSGAAVSPNGQMLAFSVEEPHSTDSQIWIKTLPDGPPQQLTRGPGVKLMPAFSPDGSRVAFTMIRGSWRWDTWVVPIIAGEPRLMLRNANSLTWAPDGRVIFSEFLQGWQLAIVMADESGGNRHDVWVPLAHQMAHYSDISPDGASVVIGYMGTGPYSEESQACFERPLEGGDADVRIIGGDHGCRFGVRYSADGRWIYFLAAGGDTMREPAGGGPAQVVFPGRPGRSPVGSFGTFGLSPDGSALYISAGMMSRNLWRGSVSGAKEQITYNGDAESPVFSRDGRYVYYSLGRGTGERRDSGIWRYDNERREREQVCPGMTAFEIAVSPDGRNLVVASNSSGVAALWTCTLDGSAPARRLIEASDHQLNPVFSPDGSTVYYVQIGANDAQTDGGDDLEALGTGGVLHRVSFDGRDPQEISEPVPVGQLVGISPDGAFLSVSRRSGTPTETWLYPTEGGEPRFLMYTWDVSWAPDSSSIMFGSSGMVSTNWVLENPQRRMLPPDLPEDPDDAWFEAAGARNVLTGIFFNTPATSNTPYEIVYRRRDVLSDLYRQELPQ